MKTIKENWEGLCLAGFLAATQIGCAAPLVIPVAVAGYNAMRGSPSGSASGQPREEFDAQGRRVSPKMGSDPVLRFVVGTDGRLTEEPADPGHACDTMAADRTTAPTRSAMAATVNGLSGALTGGWGKSFGLGESAGNTVFGSANDPNLPKLCAVRKDWEAHAAETAQPAEAEPVQSLVPQAVEKPSRAVPKGHRSLKR